MTSKPLKSPKLPHPLVYRNRKIYDVSHRIQQLGITSMVGTKAMLTLMQEIESIKK